MVKMNPDLIDLDEIECCALLFAFAKNPQLIKEMAATKVVSLEKLQRFANIMVNSRGLSLPFTEEMKNMYHIFADAEQRRLKEKPGLTFDCPHSQAEHLKALDKILKKMPVTKN